MNVNKLTIILIENWNLDKLIMIWKMIQMMLVDSLNTNLLVVSWCVMLVDIFKVHRNL
jgi:hypothetical protein